MQEPSAGIEPPVNVTDETPVVTTPLTQLVLALGGVAITMPLGKVSVNGAVRVSGILLVLLNVMVSDETAPVLMLAGLNDFFSVGAIKGVTVKVALALVALSPLVVCNVPAGNVLR